MKLIKKYAEGYEQKGGMKELIALALPMIISTSGDGVMTFTDRLFLAKIDSEQMNAAMGGGIAFQILMFFFIGLLGYTTALTAQYFGAEQKENSSKTAFQAFLVTLFASPLMLLSVPLLNYYFNFMQVPPSQAAFQMDYVQILAYGAFFSLLRTMLGCYFSGIGRTKIVMTATMAAMVTNVVLDYIFIFGKFGFPSMGIKGAAIATVSGSIVAVIMLLGAYFRKEHRLEFKISQSFKFDWKIMRKLLFYGYPSGLEMFLNFLAFSAMVSIFHSLGESAATATTIMFNWDLVSFIPLLGIEIAVTSLVGKYMGAKDVVSAHRSAISAIKTGVFYSIAILCLFVFIPAALVDVFKPDIYSESFALAKPIAITMIQIAAFYVLAEAMIVAVIGALRGAGDTHFTMLVSVTAHWLFVPLIYVMLKVFNLSIEIAWMGLVIFFLIFCGILYLRFRNGKWQNINVIG